jgi:positive regulator of sigma E activity
MVFWTVVFIIYYFSLIVRGNLFYDIEKKVSELTIKQSLTENKKDKDEITEQILKSSWSMFLMIPLVIVMFIYLFNAITIDINKYPSIVMLFYVLITTFVFKGKGKDKSKHDLTTEEGRLRFKIDAEKIKRYSFKSFIRQSIYLGYFLYMFYILVLI